MYKGGWGERENEKISKNVQIAKTYLPSGTDSPTMMSAKIHLKPANDDRHDAISADSNKMQHGVLDGDIIMNSKQNAERGNGDSQRRDGEEGAVPRPVG